MSSWIDGKVRYFDKKRGTGIIEDKEGDFGMFIIQPLNTDKPWRSLKEGRLNPNLFLIQIFKF